MLSAKQEKMVRLLLGAGAEVNAEDDGGTAPLVTSARQWSSWSKKYPDTPHPALVQTWSNLLRAGANPNADVNGGRGFLGKEDRFLLLHLAAFNRNVMLADLLLKNGADASAATTGRGTALHLAVQFTKEDDRSLTVLRLLLEGGRADVEGRDERGQTALHAAAGAFNFRSVRLLWEEGGADVNLKQWPDPATSRNLVGALKCAGIHVPEFEDDDDSDDDDVEWAQTIRDFLYDEDRGDNDIEVSEVSENQVAEEAQGVAKELKEDVEDGVATKKTPCIHDEGNDKRKRKASGSDGSSKRAKQQ